ncbi:efflux RND transporter permease subunit [Helicobacter sp. T3_23-1056]
MNVINLFLKNRVLCAVCAAFILLFGFISSQKIPYQLLPQITKPTISIYTSWAGASLYQVEKEIIEVQEKHLKNLTHLQSLVSTSRDGMGIINLEFSLQADMKSAFLQVSSKLEEISGYPENVQKPIIKATGEVIPISIYLFAKGVDSSVASGAGVPRVNIEKQKDFINGEIVPLYERIDGVGEVVISGGVSTQAHIYLNAQQLAYNNITIEEIISAIKTQNRNISAGNIDFDQRNYRLQTIGEYRSLNEVLNTIIKVQNGKVTRLKDTAHIEITHEKKTSHNIHNNDETISIQIRPTAEANILELTQKVEDLTNFLNAEILPKSNLTIEWGRDQRGFILNAISQLKSSIALGMLLAIIVLWLFLRNVASLFIIVLVIALSIIGTFISLHLFNSTLNIISLAGISFAISMVIDSGIVMLESILRNQSKNHAKNPPNDTTSTKTASTQNHTPHTELESTLKSTSKGIKEVLGALFASSITTIGIFVPILYLQDESGQLFADIGIAASSAIVIAFFVCVFILPAFLVKRTNNECKNALTNPTNLANPHPTPHYTKEYFEANHTKTNPLKSPIKALINAYQNICAISKKAILSKIPQNLTNIKNTINPTKKTYSTAKKSTQNFTQNLTQKYAQKYIAHILKYTKPLAKICKNSAQNLIKSTKLTITKSLQFCKNLYAKSSQIFKEKCSLKMQKYLPSKNFITHIATRIKAFLTTTNQKKDRFYKWLFELGDYLRANIMRLLFACVQSPKSRFISIFSFLGITIGFSFLAFPKSDYMPKGEQNFIIAYLNPPPGLSLNEKQYIANAIFAHISPFLRVNGYTKELQKDCEKQAKKHAKKSTQNLAQNSLQDSLPNPLQDSAQNPTQNFAQNLAQNPMQDNNPQCVPVIKDFFVSVGNSIYFYLVAEEPKEAKNLIDFGRNIIAQIPNVSGVVLRQEIFSVAGGSSVDINISGGDLGRLADAALQTQEMINEKFPNLNVRIVPSLAENNRELNLYPNPYSLSTNGLDVASFGNIVEVITEGKNLGSVRLANTDILEGHSANAGDYIELVLKGSEEEQNRSPEDILYAQIYAPSGHILMLGSLSEVKNELGVARIRHFEQKRNILLILNPTNTANTAKSPPLEELLESIKSSIITPLSAEFSDLDISLSGSANKLSKLKTELAFGFGLAVVITYLILSALYGSFFYPFFIILSVPLATSGGLLGLFVVDKLIAPQNLDVLTMLGFIILVGSVVNNAILIIYQARINYNDYQMSWWDSVFDSTSTRLSPIFMSMLTSVLALLPLVVWAGAGSEVYRGLGAVLIGGLMVGGIVSIFLIPALLLSFPPKSFHISDFAKSLAKIFATKSKQ